MKKPKPATVRTGDMELIASLRDNAHWVGMTEMTKTVCNVIERVLYRLEDREVRRLARQKGARK